MSLNVKRQKIARLKSGKKPRLLDLFAGCGGLSLGFDLEGFDPVCAVELDPLAAQTHAMNFFKNCSEAERELHAKPRDIVKTEPSDLISELGLGNTRTAVDVIIWGPPCQAFARFGGTKLRKVAELPAKGLL